MYIYISFSIRIINKLEYKNAPVSPLRKVSDFEPTKKERPDFSERSNHISNYC